jgi:lysyl-tRNA synthetase class 2
MSSAADDWRPTASWPVLRLRAELLARVREFFAARGFLEVETPILSADIVVDRHLDPFETVLRPDATSAEGRRLWLQTSPEFAMKRLMAAGGEAIYQIARVFRQGEQGSRHNPEFTMVEWYRRGDDQAAGMQLLSDLCEALLNRGAAERLSYRAAFERHAGVDPHAAGITDLAAALRSRGIEPPASMTETDRDAWLDLLLVELVEPHLGSPRPTIVYDYPASQAALARVREEHPPVAERFELYVDRMELANGYHELLDAEILRRRNRENNARRAIDGKNELPEESRLLSAMEHGLPDCTGVALGFDRIVMLAAGVKTVEEVLAFPIDRA